MKKAVATELRRSLRLYLRRMKARRKATSGEWKLENRLYQALHAAAKCTDSTELTVYLSQLRDAYSSALSAEQTGRQAQQRHLEDVGRLMGIL